MTSLHASSVLLKRIEAKTKTITATSNEMKDQEDFEVDNVESEMKSAADEEVQNDSFMMNERGV